MNDAEAQAFLDAGSTTIRMFLSGPQGWQRFPSVEIRPGNIANYATLAFTSPANMSASFIDGQRALAHALIDQCADSMERWARDSGRPDLLMTVAERLEKAMADE